MKLLRIVAVAALTAFGGITGGTCIVHATPATGVLLGAPAVKTLQTPTMGALPLDKAYYYYRRHYWQSPALLASALLVNSNRHLSIINLSCN
jgi:hypothetical protein